MILKYREKLAAIDEDIKSIEGQIHNRQLDIDRLVALNKDRQAKLIALKCAAEAWETAIKIAEEEGEATPKPRKRTSSKEWNRVFQILAREHPNPFGYAEIIETANGAGIFIKQASVRSKISSHVSDGYINRISDGEFCVSSKGMKHFEILKEGIKKTRASLNESREAQIEMRGAGWPDGRLPIQSVSGSNPDASTPNSEGEEPPSRKPWALPG